MTGLVSVVSTAAAAAGLGAAASGVISLIVSQRSLGVQVKLLNDIAEKNALESTDISVLGGYLYDNVGKARISSYVRDSELRGKVTRALEAITDFLGAEPTPEPESEEPPQRAERAADDIPDSLSEYVKDELRKSLSEIRFGEAWNGLARLRRLVEQELRELSPESQTSRPTSVGRLLGGLVRAGIISADAGEMLQYAIMISNAGVHGQDVDALTAENAWNAAVSGLARLEEDRTRPR